MADTAHSFRGSLGVPIPLRFVDNLDGTFSLSVSGGAGGAGSDASAANQTLEIAALNAIKTAVELLDNAVAGNELQVDVLTLPTLATVTTVGTVTTLVGSGIAHDAADSGNPHKVGAKAVAQLSAQTMVVANDRTNAHADLDGALLTRANGAVGDRVSGVASVATTTSTAVLAAGAAGIKHHITDVTLCNTSAVNVTVNLLDGATNKWTFPVPANGGVTLSFGSPLIGTAATAWNFQSSAAAATITCSVAGYKSKL